MIEADTRKDMSRSPAVMQHYVALIHPLPVQDMKQNATVANAWGYVGCEPPHNNGPSANGRARFCKST